MSTRRMVVASTLVIIATVGLTGCVSGDSDAGKTTCSQWMQIPSDPAQELQGNGQKYDIAKSMLDAHGADDSAFNQAKVVASITSYCLPDNGGNQPNADQPIDNAVKWG